MSEHDGDDVSLNYVAGIAAYHEGKPISACPIEEDEFHDEWVAGWTFAATEACNAKDES